MDLVKKFCRPLISPLAAIFLLLVSCSLGIFLFDHNSIIFKKVLPDKMTIYTNASGLGPCLKYCLLFLAGLAAVSIPAGISWARRKGRSFSQGFARQTWTLAPFLALAFGRFLHGKSLKYIMYFPLYPLLVIGVVLAVLYLNATLHFDFRLRSFFKRNILAKGGVQEEKRKTAVLVLLLASLLVHLLTLSPMYQRYSSLMIFLGDEPKYLRMAYSLASEGDLDLTDDYIGDEVEVFWRLQKALASGTKDAGHFSIVGRDGGIYHLHMPGLSFLLLPTFLLDLSVFNRDIPNTQALMFLPAKMIFTRIWILLLALGFFFLLARFLYRMFRSRWILTVLLLALIFATQVPEFMFQVYPETAAALFLVLGLNALFFPFPRKWVNALALVAAIGYLPWLHQRFIPLAVSLYALFFFQEGIRGRSWKKVLVVSLALAAVGLGYAYYFYDITGSPWPWSMYSLWGTSYTRAAMFPSGFFGYIFDTGSGLLALFPVFLLALTGMYWGVKLDRRRAGMLMAMVLPYFCLISITPWHGSVWETTRMSLILFPLFLAFIGYTLRALAFRTSWAHLVFYSAGLAFILLNRALHFWEISLGNVLILPPQVGYIIQCAFVLVFFYLILWALDLWTKKRLGPLPVLRIGHLLKDKCRGLGRFLFRPALGIALLGLGLTVQVIYVLAFLNNWNDKALAQSYFSAMAKVEASPGTQLHRSGQPSTALARTDRRFIDIFKWDVPFQFLPGQQRKSIRLGPGLMFDRCPPGCYKVDLELYDLPPDFTLISLDFMRETREMKVSPGPGKAIVSTIYLVYEDMLISPEFVMRYEAVLTRPVKGSMVFFPIPSLVFDKRLMVRLSEGLYPNCLQAAGPHLYLGFVANARKDNSIYGFHLSLQEGPAGEREAGIVRLSTYPLKFRNRGRHRIDIRLDQPGRVWPEEGTLILTATDARGRPLGCRSVWLPFRKKAWLISFEMERPFGPPSPLASPDRGGQ
ncbi:MAG TPA: hypothetical protein VGB72_00725 [Acidobacteriota bacterium]